MAKTVQILEKHFSEFIKNFDIYDTNHHGLHGTICIDIYADTQKELMYLAKTETFLEETLEILEDHIPIGNAYKCSILIDKSLITEENLMYLMTLNKNYQVFIKPIEKQPLNEFLLHEKEELVEKYKILLL